MNMTMRGMCLAVATVVAGCGSTVSVGNDNPTGTVGGMLQDATTEGPLMGATVTLTTGAVNLMATTDANGVFQFTKVPAGSFIVNYQAMGFIPVTMNRELGGAVGNFPVNNPSTTLGPIQLIPSDGTFTVRLVSDSGAPVMGVSAQLGTQVRYFDASGGARSPNGSFTVSGTSDANGLVAFQGFPNLSKLLPALSPYGYQGVNITVAPTKVMGQELYDFLGISQTFYFTGLAHDIQTVVLAGPHTGLALLASNISYLVSSTGIAGGTASQSPIAAAGPITLTFNQAVDATSIRANFFTDDGKPSPLQVMATANLNVVSLTPSPMPFAAGSRMNLNFHVNSRTQNFSYDRGNVPIFVAQAAPLAVTAKYDITNNNVTLTFNEAVGPGSNAYLGTGFNCITFFENVDFGPNVYQGEYVADPTKLSCPSFNPPSAYNPPVAGPAVDVTTMRALGDQLTTTGFSTVWVVDLGGPTSSCFPTTPYTCVYPDNMGSPKKRVHLVFSKQPIGYTFRRANGDVINDALVADVN